MLTIVDSNHNSEESANDWHALDGRCESLEVPALRTAIGDHPQEFLPTRLDSGKPLLFYGTPKPRLRSTAFEVEGHTLFH